MILNYIVFLYVNINIQNIYNLLLRMFTINYIFLLLNISVLLLITEMLLQTYFSNIMTKLEIITLYIYNYLTED